MNSTRIKAGLLSKAVINLSLFAVTMLGVSSTAYANAIGEVLVAKGKVVSRSDSRETTDLTKGAAVYEGDRLETVGRSFLIIKFNDGGRIVLRPNSQFNIDDYDDTPGQEKEKFNLVKGSLRAVTGAIGKNRPENVEFTASNTTMGIRGTTFVIKLCDPSTEACAKPENSEKLSESEKAQLQSVLLSDTSSGQQQLIKTEPLKEILEGLFIQVEEGGVRVNIGDRFFDLNPGGACSVGSSGGVSCFAEGLDLSNFEVFVATEGDSGQDTATEEEEEEIDEENTDQESADQESTDDGSSSVGNSDTPLDSDLSTSTTPGAGASPTN